MRFAIGALVLAWLAACACPSQMPPAQGGSTMQSEEEAIIAETRAFAEAWNRGDAREAASYFTEDGARVGAMGDIQHGRAELEAAYDRLLHGPFAGATVTQERGEVRMLAAGLALWQGGIEIHPAGGLPPMKGHVVQVMKKVGTRWLVLEAHPKLFPPPPPVR